MTARRGHQATPLRQFMVFWRGEQHPVQARDRTHAKVIFYAAIRPESKWKDIR